MLAPEPACLVIADISGYTSYLAGVELDHAQDILADLMDTVVAAFRPTFRLAKLEGDAAFVYAIAPTVDGSALQDAIERTYFAFRRRLRDIAAASTCECDACMRMPTLDLKVVAHHGTIARQRIAGHEELAGRPVIEVHRLLKNEVEAALGVTAYALYSDACIEAMGLTDPAASGLIGHRETYEHLGEITVWVRDLEAAWRSEMDRTRVFVEEQDAIASWRFLMPAPAAIVWEWQTSPARRPQWQHGVVRVDEAPMAGRRGVGTTNHCVHGKDAIVEEIVDWRPYEYWTQRMQIPAPGVPKFTLMYAYEPTEDGTWVTARILKPRSTKDRAIYQSVHPMLEGALNENVNGLIARLREDMARWDEEAAGAAEPDVPASSGRNLREPVDSAGARSS